MNTASILNFINTNIKTLRPLVKDLESNMAKLEVIRVEQAKIGGSILAASEWISDAEYSDGLPITEDKYAWTMSEEDFTKYYTARYELYKQSDVIRNLIPNIDEIGPDVCIQWLFNGKVLELSKTLLSLFDANVSGGNLSDCYDLEKRDSIIKAICEAVKAYCKP